MAFLSKITYICQKFTDMNCNVHKLNLCFLKQETPNNPTFKFDTDISNDSFTYTVKNYNIGQTVVYGIGSGITVVDNHTIEIEIPIDQMVIGSYSHELIWETADGTKRVVFQGLLKISETGEYCADCQTNIGEWTVNVINDEIVVNIILGSGGGNSINDVEIVPSWYTGYVDVKKAFYFYPNIDTESKISIDWEHYEPINNFIQCRVKQLNLTFKNWDLISGKNPILLIERYRPTKRSKSNNNGEFVNLEGNRKAQFIAPHNRINQIPITSENMLNIQFEQETYFTPVGENLNSDNNYICARGTKKGASQSDFQIFQFRIKTNDGISKPLLVFKLTASVHKKDAGQNYILWYNDDTPQKNNFVNIGYRF